MVETQDPSDSKEFQNDNFKNGTGSISKMGLYREFLPDSRIKLQPRDEKILIALHYNSVAKIAQKNVERQYFISKSAFYRRIKKLESWGLIHRIPDTLISEFLIDPSFQEASPIFLSLSQESSPIFECPSQTAPNGEQGQESEDSQSHSRTRSVPFSPDSAKVRANSETESKSPSEFSPKSEYQPKEGEFDEKIIRSHNYLFICPIEHEPRQFKAMLRADNWFENDRMKNWSYFYGKLGLEGIRATLQFNPNVINVRLPEVWGRNPHEDDQEANRQLLKVKAYLEEKYPRLRLGPGRFLRKALNTGKHQAWVHHPLALKAKQQNITLKKRFWEIDSSKGMPELDAIDRVQASEHLDNELEDFEDRSKTGVYFRDVRKRQDKSIESLEKTTEIQEDISKKQVQLFGGMMTVFQITEAALLHSHQALDKVSNLEEQLNESRRWSVIIKQRPKLEQVILTFLGERPKESGYTRKEVSRILGLNFNSVSPTISNLVKEGVLIEIKEGRQAGRYLLNPTHLFNQMKNNKENNHDKK